MDIEYIKRFIVVGQCLNFSKASDQLFISQPTLSHSIASIEKKLGTPLLVRNTKSVKLTRAGERFLTAAMEIVKIYEDTVNEISEDITPSNDTLKIGYIGPASDNTFTGWIKTFRKNYPTAKVVITRYATSEMAEVFDNRLIQVGFLFKMNAEKIPGLKYQEVGRERFRLCLSTDHPLADRDHINLSELKDEPFLICERHTSPNYYDRVFEICAKRNYTPNITQKVSQVGDIYRLVSMGIGVAIMSYSEFRSYDAYHVKFVDIGDAEEEDLINHIVLGWKDQLSPLGRQFKIITKGSRTSE